MPGMPGSFGRCSGPVPIATNLARISSPRLVRMIQRRASSSQVERRHLGGEHGVVVQVEVAADAAGVFEDLGGVGVLLARHVAGLFEQRQVDERGGVALGAGVAVPVPGAAEVAALLDDADVVDAGLLQLGAGDQPGEPTADEGDGDLVEQRLALGRLDVRILDVVLEDPGDLDVLLVAVGRRRLSRSSRYLASQRFAVDLGARPHGCTVQVPRPRLRSDPGVCWRQFGGACGDEPVGEQRSGERHASAHKAHGVHAGEECIVHLGDERRCLVAELPGDHACRSNRVGGRRLQLGRERAVDTAGVVERR